MPRGLTVQHTIAVPHISKVPGGVAVVERLIARTQSGKITWSSVKKLRGVFLYRMVARTAQLKNGFVAELNADISGLSWSGGELRVYRGDELVFGFEMFAGKKGDCGLCRLAEIIQGLEWAAKARCDEALKGQYVANTSKVMEAMG